MLVVSVADDVVLVAPVDDVVVSGVFVGAVVGPTVGLDDGCSEDRESRKYHV